jgi:[acyl-carrier-protein] S-malonyltransferase
MAPAADDLAEALAGIEFREPKIPVIANISATPHGAGDTIGNALVRQLTSPVLWSETMRFLRSQEVDLYLEAGPRDVLKKLVLTNLPGSTAFALDEQGDETLIEQDLAADIRAVKERPNVVGKCLAVAVCTKNNNWNEEEYQKGVVEPYRQLQAMQERLEQEAAAPDLDEMKQALALLGRIFATKGTPADERELRLRQIIETTGNEEILGDYTFLTA